MINVSSAFKNAMKAPVKVVRATVAVDGGSTYASGDVLMKLELKASGYYFGVATKAITIKLLGTDYNLLSKACNVTLDVQTSATDDTWEDCELGRFRIVEQSVDLEKGVTTLEAYDAIGVMALKSYVPGELDFPTTVNNLAVRVAADNNMGYTEQELTNGTYQIPEDLYANINGITYRDILAEIAGATASLATVSGFDSTLKFTEPKQTVDEAWTYANLKKIKYEPKYGKVSSVVIARTPQEDNIAVIDDDTASTMDGYNLVRYSDSFRTGSAAAGITPTVNEDGTLQVVAGSSNSNWHTSWWDSRLVTSSIENQFEEGDQFTIVFTIKCASGSTGKPSIYIKNGMGYYTMTGAVGTEYSELYYTGTWKKTNSISMHLGWGSCVGTFTIKNFMIKKGAYEPYEPYRENGVIEVKLANNEILDDNREAMAQPILNAVKGFYFYPFEATTEGHGWHEIGDRISVTDGTNTWELIVTDIALTIDGGIKEVIKGVAPDETTTNYALAGGITKTIYNTEIKVDKQGQEITSVVSRQDSFENETLENFSQITQNISSVVTTIQTTGGSNMLHNSVGYNIDSDGNLVNWTKTGTVTSESSPESVSYGALGGNQIDMGASSSITQRVSVSTDMQYTLSFRAKKNVSGAATVHLCNGIDDYSVTIPANQQFLWESFSIVGVQPSQPYFDVVIETNSATTLFAITDLMLAPGDSTTPWVSASDEILSKSVAIDSNGVRVSSSANNDYVQLDEFGLNGYHNGENVLTLQQDLTEVAKLKARDQITMPPIKIVPITSGTSAGWSFVKTEE